MKADKELQLQNASKAFFVSEWKDEGDLLEGNRQNLFVWLGTMAIWGWMGQLLQLSFSRVFLFVFSLAAILLLDFILRKMKGQNERRWVYGLFAGLPLILFVLPPSLSGFSGLCHEIYKKLAGRGIHFLFQGETVDSNWQKTLVIFLITCWLILLLKLCYTHWHKAFGALFLLMLFLQMRLGEGAGNTWMFVWLLWLGLMLATTVRSFLFISVPLVLFVGLFSFLFGVESGKGWERAFTRLRYGIHTQVLPDGDLTAAGNMERRERLALTVDSDAPGYYYLKGLVGTVYEDNQWKTEGQRLEDFETGILTGNGEFLQWLHGKGYSGWNELAKRMNLKKEQILQIKNKRANRRYIYLPYELTSTISQMEAEGFLISSEGERLLGTGLTGRKQYRIKSGYSLAGTAIYEPAHGKQKEIREYDAYEEYVNRTCLTLPREVKEILREKLGGMSTIGKDETMSLVKKVRKWLKDNVSYNEQPGTVPEGEEFTQWFLNGHSGGYDVQYATMAVMLFRYYGVPSRYVEGYLLENGKEISETAAHAWPEIFISGRGWVPVEVMEEYQRRMPSYLAETGEKLFASNAEMEAAQEEQSPSAGRKDQDRKKKDEERKKNPIFSNLQDEENPLLLTILLILLILALLGMLFLIFLRIREFYFRRWATESISPERSIIMWYRYCIWILYEMESDPREKMAMSIDNRIVAWEERWKKAHPEVSEKMLHDVGMLRQKAIYHRKGISWNETPEAVAFFKEEYRYLFKKLKFEGRLRVRLGLRPPFLRKKYGM